MKYLSIKLMFLSFLALVFQASGILAWASEKLELGEKKEKTGIIKKIDDKDKATPKVVFKKNLIKTYSKKNAAGFGKLPVRLLLKIMDMWCESRGGAYERRIRVGEKLYGTCKYLTAYASFYKSVEGNVAKKYKDKALNLDFFPKVIKLFPFQKNCREIPIDGGISSIKETDLEKADPAFYQQNLQFIKEIPRSSYKKTSLSLTTNILSLKEAEIKKTPLFYFNKLTIFDPNYFFVSWDKFSKEKNKKFLKSLFILLDKLPQKVDELTLKFPLKVKLLDLVKLSKKTKWLYFTGIIEMPAHDKSSTTQGEVETKAKSICLEDAEPMSICLPGPIHFASYQESLKFLNIITKSETLSCSRWDLSFCQDFSDKCLDGITEKKGIQMIKVVKKLKNLVIFDLPLDLKESYVKAVEEGKWTSSKVIFSFRLYEECYRLQNTGEYDFTALRSIFEIPKLTFFSLNLLYLEKAWIYKNSQKQSLWIDHITQKEWQGSLNISSSLFNNINNLNLLIKLPKCKFVQVNFYDGNQKVPVKTFQRLGTIIKILKENNRDEFEFNVQSGANMTDFFGLEKKDANNEKHPLDAYIDQIPVVNSVQFFLDKPRADSKLNIKLVKMKCREIEKKRKGVVFIFN